MKFLQCTLYLALTGAAGFFAGRIFPKRWTEPGKGIYRCFAFEKDGQIYEKLGIRKWQKKLPDMSRILPFLMPPKNLTGAYKERLPVMIRETCVAELTHIVMAVVGLGCLWLWPGWGGVMMTLIDILLLNLPFILIQRYNRPRLIRLQRKLDAKAEKKEEAICVS